MEIGLDENIPTYAGGLGVLAGDTIKTFADLIVPAVGITLISRKGYFKQVIKAGEQTENPVDWEPSKFMKPINEKIVITLEGRDVIIKVWEYIVRGIKGFGVPVFFLDTRCSENHPEDQAITDHLYGGDHKYRIKQEAVLGIGGIKLLKVLAYDNIKKYHMNEGHSALLTLELLQQSKNSERYEFESVKKCCVFTTHTPVPAGHDQFDREEVLKILKEQISPDLLNYFFHENKLNMTLLALKNSEHVNGVAQRHQEISNSMFPGYGIGSISNGVHSLTWTSNEFQELYDAHIPGWRHDPFNLRYALGISRKDIWEAHINAKKRLIDYVNSVTKSHMDYNSFTIGFARRMTPYKRLDLFFRDLDKLNELSSMGGIQVIIGGKAHPKDAGGKEIIKKIIETSKKLDIKVAYLENYDMALAKLLIPGVDLWLNTPRRPWEASGTSGMKAAHNGVPSFSVLDGWWIEGHVENITGWSIGPKWEKDVKTEEHTTDDIDAQDMYAKLKEIIIPMYYNDWDKWTEIMRHTIAFNASFFNTHRMVHQYVLNSYFH